MTGQVLLVDDEPVLREVLGILLRRSGLEVIEAGSAADAVAAIESGGVDLVLLDLMLPDGHGLDVIRKTRPAHPDLPFIVITAWASVDGAIEAMKEGAWHYIPKPFKNDEVVLTVRRALEQTSIRRENRALKAELGRRSGFERILGKSEPMRRVFELIRLAAPSKANILIEGEPGTGKQLVARAIHANSPRSSRPFVVVRGESIPPGLLDPTLFGAPSETGPEGGLVSSADGGTLFFDEIAAIPPEIQAKLVGLVQGGELLSPGAAPRRVDVRIIAATNLDLGRLVAEGRFREDLWYRLQVITIALPPLRQRRQDIPLLVDHFLERFAAENGKTPPVPTGEALRRLLDAPWPGNVRELENVLERAVVLAKGGELSVELLPDSMTRPARPAPGPFSFGSLPPPGVSLKEAVEEYEREMILRALSHSGGVQKRAAELLRIRPTTLNEMIKRLGIGSRREELSLSGGSEE